MPPTPYAGLVTRATALLVDAIVINVLAAIAGAAIGLIGSLAGAGRPGLAAAVTGGTLWLGWTGLYFVAFWTVAGQTPGGRLLDISVASTGPRDLGLARAALRFVVMMLALAPLGAGFFTVLFDDRRRGPHDMAAGTVVRRASVASVAGAAAPLPEPQTVVATVPASAGAPPLPADEPPTTGLEGLPGA
ncbi:MAG TPA: RDD family protein [Solirubrobacteraceae bacterium]|nr:RDD family protein [Solirubrobacteraceae bacterium]